MACTVIRYLGRQRQALARRLVRSRACRSAVWRLAVFCMALQLAVTLPVFLIYLHYRRAVTPRPGGRLAEFKDFFFPDFIYDAKEDKRSPAHQKLSHQYLRISSQNPRDLSKDLTDERRRTRMGEEQGQQAGNAEAEPRVFPNPHRTNPNHRQILVWTPIFLEYRFWDRYLHSPGMEDCHHSTRSAQSPLSSAATSPPRQLSCSYTFDRDLANSSDALLFHYIDVDKELKDMPPRNPYQKWLLFVEDPPYLHGERLVDFRGLFNWTITYREGSDVQRLYGKFERRPPVEEESFESIKRRIQGYGERKVAVWLASNCITQGRREDFVEELRKHVDVDVYGQCGEFNCTGRMSDACYRHLESGYMFYLAFENSICKDYVTEKFFNAAKLDMVPVVFGGAVYEKLVGDLPADGVWAADDGNQRTRPLVYIDALEFPSPKQLALELLRLSRDERAYLEYFRWKVSYRSVAPYNWHCDLCNKLHLEGDVSHPAKTNLYEWWQQEANCQWWPLRSRGHKPWTWD